GISVQQVILGLALLAGLCWNLARASEINNLRVSAGATGTRAEIGLDEQVEYRILTLSNPERLVVDLPGVDPVRGLELPAAAGLVKDVRTGQPVPGTTRIVFDLLAPVVALKPRFESGADGTRLVVEWPGENTGDPIARIAAATANRPVAGADPQAGAATPAQSPPSDPAIASAAATSRLVAATVAPTAPSASPAPVPSTTPVQAEPQASGTIATGVPTRIATGVPTPVADPKPAPPAATPPLARRAGMRP